MKKIISIILIGLSVFGFSSNNELLFGPKSSKINKNQPEAAKAMNSGEGKWWMPKSNEWKNVDESHDRTQTCKLTFQYNENGTVKSVEVMHQYNGKEVWKSEFISPRSTGFGKNNVTYPYYSYFVDKSASSKGLVYYEGTLYNFKIETDYNSFKLVTCYGNTPIKFEKARVLLQDYQGTIRAEKASVKEMALKRKEKFDETFPESGGYSKVKKDGKYGFVNKNMEVVIPIKYEACFNEIKQGIIGVQLNGKQGYVNIKNEIIIPIEHDRVKEIDQNAIRVVDNGKSCFYSLEGEKKTPYFDAAGQFKRGQNIVFNDGMVGYVDTDFNVGWLFDKDEYEGVVYYGQSLYKVSKNERVGLVNAKGEEVLPIKYKGVYLPHDNISCIKSKEGKFGYFNVTKGWITELIYDKGTDFKEGSGKLHFNKESGTCDVNGKITWIDGFVTPTSTNPKGELEKWRSNYSEVISRRLEKKATLVKMGENYSFVTIKNGIASKSFETEFKHFKQVRLHQHSSTGSNQYYAVSTTGSKNDYDVFDIHYNDLIIKDHNDYWIDASRIIGLNEGRKLEYHYKKTGLLHMTIDKEGWDQTNQNTSSNNNYSSSGDSSSNDSSDDCSFTIENDTGTKHFVWWWGTGTGWLGNGSSKTSSCPKGTKIYGSTSSSSSSKKFLFEAGSEINKKTIKLSNYF